MKAKVRFTLRLCNFQCILSSGGDLTLLRDELSQRANTLRYQDLCSKTLETEIKAMEKEALQKQVCYLLLTHQFSKDV